MTTQVKPKGGGSFTTITADSVQCATISGNAAISALPFTGQQHLGVLAVNMWHNCGGTGDAATRAMKIADAAGLALQEI